MAIQYRLMLRPTDAPGPVTERECMAYDNLDVREITTKARETMQVKDISLYRHNVFFEGKEFVIVNVVRTA